jgi:hypothetical protein
MAPEAGDEAVEAGTEGDSEDAEADAEAADAEAAGEATAGEDEGEAEAVEYDHNVATPAASTQGPDGGPVE